MKNFKQIVEDIGAIAANNTSNVPTVKEPVVSKKKQKDYVKQQSSPLNTGRKIKSNL
jgi:transcriptional regulator of NAD metabolism